MTALEQALSTYTTALKAHHIAGHGERTRARKALEAANRAVLEAENAANAQAKAERRNKILQVA